MEERVRRIILVTTLVAALVLMTIVAVIGFSSSTSTTSSPLIGHRESPAGPAIGTFYFPPSQDLQFVSSRIGWTAVPGKYRILGTTDGGHHWWTSYQGPISSQTATGYIESIAFVNATDGWALVNGEGLMSTRNGGHTWSAPREPTEGAVMNFVFASPENGWATTSKGVLLRSLNAGATWQTVTTPAPGTSLCATPSGGLWLGVSETGNVYFSNKGVSWRLSLAGSAIPFPKGSIPSPPPLPAPWISCSGDTAWLLYDYGEGAGSMPYVVDRTLNAGRSWKVVASSEVTPAMSRGTAGVFASVSDFGMTGPKSAWAVGYCGPCTTGGVDVAITTNAVKFTNVSLSSNPRIHAQPVAGAFADRRHGWVILQEDLLSKNGSPLSQPATFVVVATTNGGEIWHVVDANLQE
jgi:hypothetical protein